MDAQIKKTDSYIQQNLLFIFLKKKDILSFVTPWMNLEGFMLCENNQASKDKFYIN